MSNYNRTNLNYKLNLKNRKKMGKIGKIGIGTCWR